MKIFLEKANPKHRFWTFVANVSTDLRIKYLLGQPVITVTTTKTVYNHWHNNVLGTGDDTANFDD